MFPITDKEGRTIGFGARILEEDPKQPKYLNSPESPLFAKRKVFYGLHENQRGIRKRGELVIVEGYMDVVGLAEAGVDNAVATMGTAVTEDHLLEIKNITRKVITVFDPDNAGKDAWHRSIALFLQSGIIAKDVSLPEGKDPDEFVKESGSESFYALCDKAPRQVTKYLTELAQKAPLTEEQTNKALEDLFPLLLASKKLPDRATLWDSVSRVLKISVPTLQAILEQQSRLNTGSLPSPKSKIVLPPLPGKKTQNKSVPIKNLDLHFLKACLLHPEKFLKTEPKLWMQGIENEKIRTTLEDLARSPSLSTWSEHVTLWSQSETDPLILAALTEALLNENKEVQSPGQTDEYEYVLERVQDKRNEKEIQSLSTLIHMNQKIGSNDQEQLILLEKLRLLRTKEL
jgi:DNA primase